MKIACFVADESGCGFYRVTQPYSLLREHEVRFRKAVVTPDLYWCDVAVFQRVDHPDVISRMREVKALGKRVILDFDDQLHDLPASNPCATVWGAGKEATNNFEEALDVADLVTASTQALADAYSHFRTDIMVCENFVDSYYLKSLSPVEIDGSPKITGQVRIGYVGSPTHDGDIASVSQALTKVARLYPEVRFVFFGQKSCLPAALSDRVEYHPCIGKEPQESLSEFMLRYYKKIGSLNLDIAIAPLKANAFNDCKSFIKCLEYGMMGIPIVASDVGPYSDYIERGGPIVTAHDHHDWIGHLSALVEEGFVRRGMAEANLKHIRRNHTEASALIQWEAALASLVPVCTTA